MPPKSLALDPPLLLDTIYKALSQGFSMFENNSDLPMTDLLS